MTRILILGSTGLLGSTILKYFSEHTKLKCFGIVRKNSDKKKLEFIKKIKLFKVDYENKNHVSKVFAKVKPHLIINCIGVVKQIVKDNKISEIIKVNSYLPHHLSELANKHKKVRFIHFSTDCVFSGLEGNYKENDFTDANDIYGKSKILGELSISNFLTLRTSIIGHELKTNYSLLDWFLAQKTVVKGYKNAVFSGLTALEISKVLNKYVIPNKNLRGVYHLSGKSINKYDLLEIIKRVYKKDIKIMIDKKTKINRSLNSNLFQKVTGYKPKDWTKLIEEMYEFYKYK